MNQHGVGIEFQLRPLWLMRIVLREFVHVTKVWFWLGATGHDLFVIVYKRTSRALLHRDHVMLAVLLSQVKLRGVEEITDELEFFLESGDGVVAGADAIQSTILTPDQAQRVVTVDKQPMFKPVLTHLTEHEDDWIPFLESASPEQSVPSPWEPGTREYTPL